MKCNQFRPWFELVSPCPFPVTITILPRAPPKWYKSKNKRKSETGVRSPLLWNHQFSHNAMCTHTHTYTLSLSLSLSFKVSRSCKYTHVSLKSVREFDRERERERESSSSSSCSSRCCRRSNEWHDAKDWTSSNLIVFLYQFKLRNFSILFFVINCFLAKLWVRSYGFLIFKCQNLILRTHANVCQNKVVKFLLESTVS